MPNKIIFSVDVEKDINQDSFNGVLIGLKNFENICDKNNIRPVLFVTGEVLEKFSKIFKRLYKKGWEISSHGYTHKRFDDLSNAEKEKEIQKIVKLYSKFSFKLEGFRAPQHSIDKRTLDLLNKYGFKYDSSYTPLNLFQFLFFPQKIVLNIRGFFSPLNEYKIRSNLREKPCPSLLIPFVSLTMRVLPKPLIKLYLRILNIFYKKPIFYAHSWDFIELKNSKIDRKFPHKNLLNKIDYLMSLS